MISLLSRASADTGVVYNYFHCIHPSFSHSQTARHLTTKLYGHLMVTSGANLGK